MQTTQAIALIDQERMEELGIRGDSAMAHMLLNQFTGGPLFDESDYVDEETKSDHAGIDLTVPRIRMNVKLGQFISSQDPEEKNPPNLVRGVILCRESSNIFFAFNRKFGDRISLVKTQGFDKLVDHETGYICRSLSDGTAELNPNLTPEQVAEAKRLKFGPTQGPGMGCATCPHSKWIKVQSGKDEVNKRLCSDSENIVWLDSKLGEPVVLGIISGSAVRRFRDWSAQVFQHQRKKLNFFVYAVELAFTGEKDDMDVNILSMRVLGSLSKEQKDQLREVRAGFRNMLERATLANASQGFAEGEQDPEKPAEPTLDPGPEDDVLGGML